MSVIESRLGVIIPTKDRPEDLRNLLNSISSQNIWPSKIIIIDGGDSILENVIRDFIFFDITYLRQKPASLPAQKNKGLDCLRKNIEVVAFFDDDIILSPGAIEEAMGSFNNLSDKVCGVACNNISHPRPKISLMQKIFLVGSDKVGIILRSGFQSKICSLDKNYWVQWLIGGATFWKRNIFERHRFDEWYYGYAHCEDLDFSYPLSREYKLVALKNAKFIHKTKPIRKKYEYALGKMQVANRVHFVKKHREFSLILCYWSCTGLLLKNLFLGLLCFRTKYLLRSLGVSIGILISFLKDNRIKERIKI